jgi:hypothetical protein
MALVWVPLRGTSNLALVDEDDPHTLLRKIAVRDPYLTEGPWTRFEVSGAGHRRSKHDSLADAKAAAEASLN